MKTDTLVHRLTYRRANRDLHVHGYREEGAIIDRHGQPMPEIVPWKWGASA